MQFETKKRNEKYAKKGKKRNVDKAQKGKKRNVDKAQKGKKRNETNKMLQCLTVSIQTRMQNIVE